MRPVWAGMRSRHDYLRDHPVKKIDLDENPRLNLNLRGKVATDSNYLPSDYVGAWMSGLAREQNQDKQAALTYEFEVTHDHERKARNLKDLNADEEVEKQLEILRMGGKNVQNHEMELVVGARQDDSSSSLDNYGGEQGENSQASKSNTRSLLEEEVEEFGAEQVSMFTNTIEYHKITKLEIFPNLRVEMKDSILSSKDENGDDTNNMIQNSEEGEGEEEAEMSEEHEAQSVEALHFTESDKNLKEVVFNPEIYQLITNVAKGKKRVQNEERGHSNTKNNCSLRLVNFEENPEIMSESGKIISFSIRNQGHFNPEGELIQKQEDSSEDENPINSNSEQIIDQEYSNIEGNAAFGFVNFKRKKKPKNLVKKSQEEIEREEEIAFKFKEDQLQRADCSNFIPEVTLQEGRYISTEHVPISIEDQVFIERLNNQQLVKTNRVDNGYGGWDQQSKIVDNFESYQKIDDIKNAINQLVLENRSSLISSNKNTDNEQLTTPRIRGDDSFIQEDWLHPEVKQNYLNEKLIEGGNQRKVASPTIEQYRQRIEEIQIAERGNQMMDYQQQEESQSIESTETGERVKMLMQGEWQADYIPLSQRQQSPPSKEIITPVDDILEQESQTGQPQGKSIRNMMFQLPPLPSINQELEDQILRKVLSDHMAESQTREGIESTPRRLDVNDERFEVESVDSIMERIQQAVENSENIMSERKREGERESEIISNN